MRRRSSLAVWQSVGASARLAAAPPLIRQLSALQACAL